MEKSDSQPGVGSILNHPIFGRGLVIKADDSTFTIVFDSGESRRIDRAFEGIVTEHLVEPSEIPEEPATRSESSSDATSPTISAAAPGTAAPGASDHGADVGILKRLLEDFGLVNPSTAIGKRWSGGKMILVPGKSDTQSKEIPLDIFFKKIIGVRERLRVLEQKINNLPDIPPEAKLELQGYITRSYGSLTTFNVLFADKSEYFVGGGKDE